MTNQDIPNPFIPKISLAETMRALAGSLEPASYVRALLVTGANQLETQAGIMLRQQQAINAYLSEKAAPVKATPNLDLLARARALDEEEAADGADDSDPA